MKLLILLLSLYSIAGFSNVKLTQSEILFVASGKPSFIKARGSVPLVSSSFTIVDDNLAGSVKADLKRLDSGIELRDSHLKEKYLNTKKFPHANLVIEKQKIKLDGENQVIKGRLEVHGVEKDVLLNARLEKRDGILRIESKFEFLLTDHGITLPSFQGITAANKVKLIVVAELKL